MAKKLIILISVILLIIGGLVWFKNEIKKSFLTRSEPIYAVHLNNGHVYLGNIKSVSADTIVLKNTHFLQMIQTQSSAPIASSSNFQIQPINNSQQAVYGIVKRSKINEIMPTDDILFIERRNVLFWEKLNSDSDIFKLFKEEK